MKQMLSAVLAAAVLAFSTGAQAADPALLVSVDGVTTRSVAPALFIDRDTSAGYNRVAITYPGTTGTQYLKDDVLWSKHAAAKNYILAEGGMRVGVTDRYVAVRKHIDGQCSGSSTYMQFENTSNQINVGGGDGCALWQAVKAVAN